MDRSITAITRSPGVTGIVSCRTGTPVVHSGSPSRQIRRSRNAAASERPCPAGRTVPDDVVRQARWARSSGASAPAPPSRTRPAAAPTAPGRRTTGRPAAASRRSARAASRGPGRGARPGAGEVGQRRHSVIIAAAAGTHAATPVGYRPASGHCRGCLPAGNVAGMSADEQPAHGGARAVAAARPHGVQTMFTLSGGHVFPLYDGAVTADPPMRIVDVRHEQTAVFAAEATARLTRAPGPGRADRRAGRDQRRQRGDNRPLQRLARWWCWRAGLRTAAGARAACRSWTTRRCCGPVTKRAWTVHEAGAGRPGRRRGVRAGQRPGTAGRCSWTRAWRRCSARPRRGRRHGRRRRHRPDRGHAVDAAARRRSRGQPDPDGDRRDRPAAGARPARPVLVLGSDVWLDGAEQAARTAAEQLRLPVIANGQGRGILPGRASAAGHPGAGGRLGEADLVIVAGTPLDFRLGYGEFGGKNGTPPARSCTSRTPPSSSPRHCELAASAAGDLAAFFAAAGRRGGGRAAGRGPAALGGRLAAPAAGRPPAGGRRGRRRCCPARPTPIHPLRIYGELARLLEPTRSSSATAATSSAYAGKYVEPQQPGCWLDPGPTAAWAPASATPSRPGSPARRRRWCCCSGTARPGSR